MPSSPLFPPVGTPLSFLLIDVLAARERILAAEYALTKGGRHVGTFGTQAAAKAKAAELSLPNTEVSNGA